MIRLSTQRFLSKAMPLALMLVFMLQAVIGAAAAHARQHLASPASAVAAQIPGCGTGFNQVFTVEENSSGGKYIVRRNTCEANVLVTEIRARADGNWWCATGAATIGGVAGIFLAVPGAQLPAGVVAISALFISGTCVATTEAIKDVANKIQAVNQRCGTLGIQFNITVRKNSLGVSAATWDGYSCQLPDATPFADLGPVSLTLEVPKYDYAFTIDTTGSMVSSLDSVKASLIGMLDTIGQGGVDWRVCVVAFRDQGDNYVSKVVLGFSSDRTAITNAINSLSADGGGDTPEAVYSGLMTAINQPWRATATKQILLLGDAAPKDPEPGTGFTQNSVVAAAAAVGVAQAPTVPGMAQKGPGLSRPLLALGTPVRIYATLIDVEPAARSAFQQLSSRTGGGFGESPTGTNAGSLLTTAINANRTQVNTAYVRTLAGAAGQPQGSTDGYGAAARFSYPQDIGMSANETFALITDSGSHVIRRLDRLTNQVTTIAGTASTTGGFANGIGSAARFKGPDGIAVSRDGTFALIADTGNQVIRRINLATNEVTTIAGDLGVRGAANGIGLAARFNDPREIALSPNNGFALIIDYGNFTIRRINLSTNQVTTIAGGARQSGYLDGIGISARFSSLSSIALGPNNTYALIGEQGNHVIRRINLSNNEVTTIAGTPGDMTSGVDGIGPAARFRAPRGIEISKNGTFAIIADDGNQTIRRLDLLTREVKTIAGSVGLGGGTDGFASAARFNGLGGMALAADDSTLLLVDRDSFTIRQVTLTR